MVAKKMKKLTMQYSPRYLSDDILFQLLSRLPVKSLLRFTSVSKSWKSCIKSSSFISLHHRHQIANNDNDNNSCSHLVYIPDEFLDYVQDCTLIRETREGARPKISIPRLSSSSKTWVACSCGGLICLRTESTIYIWNPFIIGLKQIPAGEIPLSPSCKLGFGFSPQRGDYRLLKLQLPEVEIYSLSSDSWRRIKPNYTRKGYNNYSSPLSCKGHIYWFCNLYENNEYVRVILRFDLDKEIFEEIIVPTSLFQPFNYGIELVVSSNGFLVLLQTRFWGKHILMSAVIIKKSESELESAGKSSCFLKITKEFRKVWTTLSGHIIVEGGDGRIFVYCCNFDGNDWSYEMRDLGVNQIEDQECCLIPITDQTLLLPDEK